MDGTSTVTESSLDFPDSMSCDCSRTLLTFAVNSCCVNLFWVVADAGEGCGSEIAGVDVAVGAGMGVGIADAVRVDGRLASIVD